MIPLMLCGAGWLTFGIGCVVTASVLGLVWLAWRA
jgi:hypothetical protein